MPIIMRVFLMFVFLALGCGQDRITIPTEFADPSGSGNPGVAHPEGGSTNMSGIGIGIGISIGGGNSVVPSPLNLAGNANLGGWLIANSGITLGTTLLKTGTGGAITISGTSGAGLAQSSAVHGIIMSTGQLTGTIATIAWSTDGGLTFQPTIPITATMDLGNGITAAIPAATYNIGTIYEATVAQWVEQKNGYVFSQATVTKQPVLRRTSSGLEVVPDGVDDELVSTTAGVATSFAVTSAPFSLFIAMRSGRLAGATSNIFTASQSNAATKLYNLFTNSAAWNTFTGGAANSGAGVIVASTRYVVELWNTGTQANLIANGVQQITNVAQVPGLNNTVNQVTLFGANSNGTPSQWGDNAISEVIWYTGNQHAVTSIPITAYLNSRWAATASVTIPDASFFDQNGVAATTSINPVAWAPNDYRIWLPDRLVSAANANTSSPAAFRRVKVSVPAGVTALQVSAVPYLTAISIPSYQVAAYADGSITPTILSFPGAFGLKQVATLGLDGSAHTIELEDRAAIVGATGVGGTVTTVTPGAPNTRVVIYGDSIVDGHLSSDPSKGWSVLVRHALDPAIYATTIWGIPSKQGSDDCATSPLVTASVAALGAMFDGTSKNILVDAFGTNDYGLGNKSAANYAIWKGNQYDALHAAFPSLKILVLSPIKRGNETAINGGGSTLPDFRTVLQAVVSARSTYCTYLGGDTVITIANTVYLQTDLLHPNDFGYATMSTSLVPAIQAQ